MPSRFDTQSSMPSSCAKTAASSYLTEFLVLKPSGKIHRHDPARQKTSRPERAADSPEDLFTCFFRYGTEFREPLAYPSSMITFLGFDFFDPLFFGRIFQRLPMPAIGIHRGDLARAGVLEDADEALAALFNSNESPPKSIDFGGDSIRINLSLLTVFGNRIILIIISQQEVP